MRSYSYDALGRVTSETNPENGTTSYTFDSDSTCGSSPGNLVKKVDAMGNVTCFAYDKLHRKASVTYPSGPYASITRPKYIVYDMTSFSCSDPTGWNIKGHLAEAYTGSSGSKTTDLAYCYSPRGETADVYEATPHSGGYYHVPVTYWANGLMQNFGPFLSQRQVNIMPDGEGRTYSVTNAGSNVPSINYNAASQPTRLMTSRGGGTCYPITYTYDPNTLRMTQYSAALNGGTVSGTMTWNPNGSLQSLAISDPFHSTDTQTCSYGADDLSRLAGVNCGSPWSQSFSYDPFGNITKSGSISWMPGYNQSTNRYTLGGTSYDAEGNVTNDSFLSLYLGCRWKEPDHYLPQRSGLAVHARCPWESGGTRYANGRQQLLRLLLPDVGRDSLVGHWAKPVLLGVSPAGRLEGEPGGRLDGSAVGGLAGHDPRVLQYTGGGYTFSGAHAPFGESYGWNSGYPFGFAGHGGAGWGEGDDGSMSNTTYWAPERDLRSSQGRWLSPDPAGMAAADPSDPQSWNRYAYVMNNPLGLTDPSGLEPPGTHRCWSNDGFKVQWWTTVSCNESPHNSAAGNLAFLGGWADAFQMEDVVYVPYGAYFQDGGCRGCRTGVILFIGGGSEGATDDSSAATDPFTFLKKLNTCVNNNAKNYSIGGALNLAFNKRIQAVAWGAIPSQTCTYCSRGKMAYSPRCGVPPRRVCNGLKQRVPLS